MNLDFKEGDIEILDRMLEYIAKNSGPHNKSTLVAYNIVSEMSKVDYDYYAGVINKYCGEIVRYRHSNDYNIRSDDRTAIFYRNGGFWGLFEKESKENNKNTIMEKLNTTADNKDIFIVHGSDDALKNEVARFLEKDLELNAIILHEKPNSGKTIIEKIEKYTNVGFAIILYTPCDEGRRKKKGQVLKNRARQNVVLEHGYLMGKIGRENICVLVKGKIELPGDIDGIVYSKTNNWREGIRKELKAANYIS